jgi:ubiquinone/menaquinone biosynthesis C-methylase UbiE
MSSSSDQRVVEFYSQTYDESVPDWPGEIEFYRGLASEVRQKGDGLLEIACGTGRVTIRLAQDGTHTVGLDQSPKMLEVAREKSKGVTNIRWVQTDMCEFDLGEIFGLAIIPGHSFQNLNTSQEQVACLQCIYHHLKPGGRLVVHLDHQNIENVGWLGSLVGEKSGVFEPAEQFLHIRTGRQVRALRAWAYEPATQTAICMTAWEAISTDGQVVDRWQTEPIRLHCVFRFEMEHLLARVGFSLDDLYGDFFQNQLNDKSSNMIWIAHKPESVASVL